MHWRQLKFKIRFSEIDEYVLLTGNIASMVLDQRHEPLKGSLRLTEIDLMPKDRVKNLEVVEMLSSLLHILYLFSLQPYSQFTTLKFSLKHFFLH